MDPKELLKKYSPFLKRNLLTLSLGALGMIFFAYGLIGLFLTSKTASDDIVFESSSEKNSVETKTIFVDIEGAVVNPGLYKLPRSSRIQDALVASGGLAVLADRQYVAKNLNLAAELTDGAKIYIFSVGEVLRLGSGPNSPSEGKSAGALININISSQSQLETLSGIGQATAAKIIEARPYSSVDELLSKKIVGSKVFGRIKDKITVY